ncbi:Uracil-DNA glycosylase [Citrus sinensis]|nr:Uracil-DNA glycosylase [Citrus sinensis]
MGSSKTIMDLFQPAAKRFKLSSPHCCASDNTPNSKPLLQVVSRKLPLSSKSSGSSSAITTSLTAEQQSRIEFNRYVAKSKRNLKACSQKVSKAKEEGSGYVKLEELLAEETWLEVLHGELQKPYAKRLCEFVEKEIKDSGVDIFPPQHLIFNALNTTPFDRVKAVIIGQDPYHGPGQAMGLSFSVPEGVKIPSSLANIFKEIHQDVGCRLPSHGNLEKWAVQGVLLLNTVLTGRTQTCKRKSSIRGDDWQRHSVAADRLDDIWRVVGIDSIGLAILEHYERLFHFLVRRHQANSHAKKGWEQFTDAVIKAISDKKEGVVFLLWGNSAQEKSRLINVTKHHILKAAHPSGLSANRGFFGCSDTMALDNFV